MISLNEDEFREILEDALIELTRGKRASIIIKEALNEAIRLDTLKPMIRKFPDNAEFIHREAVGVER